jgi:hypothetical protein
LSDLHYFVVRKTTIFLSKILVCNIFDKTQKDVAHAARAPHLLGFYQEMATPFLDLVLGAFLASLLIA